MRWYNNLSKLFMSRGYLRDGQTIDERIRKMAEYSEEILQKKGFADKFEEYCRNGWYIEPTPCWTNFGADNGGSAISCFGLYVDDNVPSILNGVSEAGMQNKIGGGTSGYFGAIRPRGSSITGGGISNGSVSFMELYETTSNIISQASRRGHFSTTLDIDHGDIDEFLRIRSEGHPIQDLSFSVSISDDFMNRLYKEDPIAVERFRKVVECRFRTGFPYIFFSDNVNNNTVDVYKDNDLKIWHSNMCHEIALPNNNKESFVCNLLGMNLQYFEEWKDTDAVEVAIYFMDSMLTDFINKNKSTPYMDRAVRFAERHRAMGLGASGYHSYLQSKMIPFESLEAKLQNTIIFRTIHDQAYAASQKMAVEYGKPEILIDDKYNRRHSCLLAIAPNTSSAFIKAQQSQSIEPLVSNYYIKDVAKMRVSIKNPHLIELLESIGKNTDAVWDSILIKNGSVQHLDFLTDEQKLVFKTFSEISQYEILLQASQRQRFIDQSQSLNLMIPEGSSPDDVAYLIITAHQLGIKTLYYQLNVNAAQQFTNSITECVSCSG